MFANATIKPEDVELILGIHRYKRPKGSRTEQSFVDAFLTPLGVKPDTWGNLHLIVGDKPKVLWSCHTDTVHTSEGFQRLHISSSHHLTLSRKDDSNCLGADDGAGIFIMMCMIKAKVPGHYIFHYGEEKGCEGSTNIATKNPEILKNIDIALAFDRRDSWDVITRISGSTVCSDDFAQSLITQLPPGYRIGTFGMRTDVKLYEKLVAECCNISVGYTDPHMKTEKLDMMHLVKLRDAMLKIDVTKLKVKRDPTKVEPAYTHHGRGTTPYVYNDGLKGDEYRPKTIHDIVKNSGALVADLMIEAGVNIDTLQALILEAQLKSKRTYNYSDFRRMVPDPKWVNPHAPKTEEAPKTETKVEEASHKSMDQTDKLAETITPAMTQPTPTQVPSRGGGAPSNVIDLVSKKTDIPEPNHSDKHKLGAD